MDCFVACLSCGADGGAQVSFTGASSYTAGSNATAPVSFDVVNGLVSIETTGVVEGDINASGAEAVVEITSGTFYTDITAYVMEASHVLHTEGSSIYIVEKHVYEDGQCRCGKQDPSIPLTGDRSNLMLYAAVMALSAAMMMTVKKKAAHN